MNDTYAIINRNSIESAWQGAPLTLAPRQSVLLPRTPQGPLVIVYRLDETLESMASLTLNSDGGAVQFIRIQPGADLPGIYVTPCHGQSLCITNISHTPEARVWIAAFGVLEENSVDLLPLETPLDFPNQATVRSTEVAGIQQLGIVAQSTALSLFALIIGESGTVDQEVAVLALNAPENTGPGMGVAAPPGYYATTKAGNMSYELLPKDGSQETRPIYLINLSPEPAPATVFTRLL